MHKTLITAAALVALASPAMAEHLYSGCEHVSPWQWETGKADLCLGYIAGLADVYNGDPDYGICLPDGAVFIDVAKKVTESYKAHPDWLGLPPRILVKYALREIYPCIQGGRNE